MNILVDIDSTCTNFSEVLLAKCNEKHGTRFKPESIKTYNWFDEKFYNPWDFCKTNSFWDEVDVLPYVRDTLVFMVSRGHSVKFVTASQFNSTLEYKLSTFIKKMNSPWFTTHDIIVAQDKGTVNGDILIDDNVTQLTKFEDKSHGIGICYTQPWNRRWKGLRFDSWEAMFHSIESKWATT